MELSRTFYDGVLLVGGALVSVGECAPTADFTCFLMATGLRDPALEGYSKLGKAWSERISESAERVVHEHLTGCAGLASIVTAYTDATFVSFIYRRLNHPSVRRTVQARLELTHGQYLSGSSCALCDPPRVQSAKPFSGYTFDQPLTHISHHIVHDGHRSGLHSESYHTQSHFILWILDT